MIGRVLMTADAVGGVFTYAVALAGALARAGVRTTLATMGPRPAAAQRAAARAIPGLRLVESDYALEWMDDPWRDVEAAGEWLLRLDADERPDVIHLNGYVHAGLPWSAPVVVVAHSCVFSWWRAVEGRPAPDRYAPYREAVAVGLSHAAAVVAPTRWMLDALPRHYGASARGVVVPNGIDLARRGRPPRKEPFVLAAGRIWDRAKNVETLAAVAPRLTWPVVVAGAENAPGAAPMAVPGVRTLGWLEPEALGAWMDRAAVFASPARYEPFGLGILEAALRGCALVLGDIPSLREVWGTAAAYVPPDDGDALARAIERLARGPGARARLAAAAEERAKSYSTDAMAARTLAIYRAITAPRSAGPSLENACV
jgi:glycosyltransferase involved in cell wall biosynthesis